MTTEVIIRKQKLKFKTSDEEQARQLRILVNDHMQYSFLPVYESVFSMLEGDIYIDKLVLSLGNCSLSELDEKIPARLREELIRLLKGENRFAFQPLEKTDLEIQTGDEQISDEQIKETNDKAALIYFLEKGIYPWWYTKTKQSPADIIAALSIPEMEILLLKIRGILKPASSTKAEVIKARMAQQLNEWSYDKLMNAFISLQSDSSTRVNMNILIAKDTAAALANYFSLSKTAYQRALIIYFFDHLTGKNSFEIKEFLIKLKDIKDMYRSRLKRDEKDKKSADDGDNPQNEIKIPNTLPSLLKKVIEKISLETEEKNNSNQKENTSNQIASFSNTSKESSTQQNLLARENQNQKTKVSELFAEEEGIYIDNAGLIILHPFLMTLFTELNLLNAEGKFISEDCKQKAVIILNYIYTGENEYQEHTLAFNKILCALKPEENLPDQIILSPDEKTECNQLLDVVINYWEALKGASREALRETFLSRKAKLSFNNEHYLLQVERNATDILLDRLPWGLGIVRLPWLENLIHVEW